jgi:hypothetical protein
VVIDADLLPGDGPRFASPGSDVNMDTVQSIATKAMEFQAESEKRGVTITISEAVGAVTRKKR